MLPRQFHLVPWQVGFLVRGNGNITMKREKNEAR